MLGMNPEPCASYSLAERFVCNKCHTTPHILAVEGRDPLTVRFECHGKQLIQNFTKSDLIFTQYVFEKENEDE